jgi:methionyl-tRNA formyltransferase
MKILFCTKGERGRLCLKALRKTSHTIVGLIEAPGGTTEITGVESFCPEKINSSDVFTKIQNLNPDLMVLAGYTQIIKKSLIDFMNQRKCIINLHGGKLPEYRGGSPLNWQIINGEKTIGLSIIQVDEGIDSGPVLAEESFPIDADQTIEYVYAQANERFPRMMVDVINAIEAGTVKAKIQDEHKARYWKSRWPKDSRIDWSTMTALEVHNLVRAVTRPLGGADTNVFNGPGPRPLKIWRTALLEESCQDEPGKILFKKKNGFVVMAKDQGLLITEVQPVDSDAAINAAEYFESLPMKFNAYLK